MHRFSKLILLPLTAVLCGAVCSLPAPVFAADYEIPLSDLKKVERKKPKKSEGPSRREKEKEKEREREREKEKKKADEARKSKEHPAESPAPKQLGKKEAPAHPAAEQKAAPAAAPLEIQAEPIRITHDPYSYVVPGKRTQIRAIVSSRNDLKGVRCLFRSSDTGGYASIPMMRDEGSRYTYSATLPALAEGSKTLRYLIIATEEAGKEFRSSEFVSPVKSAWVMPGWQQDPDSEALAVEVEDASKPLEGFADKLQTPKPAAAPPVPDKPAQQPAAGQPAAKPAGDSAAVPQPAPDKRQEPKTNP